VSQAETRKLSGGPTRVYNVVKGDTLTSICTHNSHTSLRDLLKLNPHINNGNVIKIGMKLKVRR
jgi:LysM repeat protein